MSLWIPFLVIRSSNGELCLRMLSKKAAGLEVGVDVTAQEEGTDGTMEEGSMAGCLESLGGKAMLIFFLE